MSQQPQFGQQFTAEQVPTSPQPYGYHPQPPVAPPPYGVVAVVPPFAPYASARVLAVLAAVAAAVVVLLQIAVSLTSWGAAADFRAAVESGGTTMDVFTVYDGLVIVQPLALVGAYVVGCLWLWRARRNAEALAPHAPHARARGWIWAAWLVPFVSLVFPYQIVRDVRAVCRPAGALVGGWWTAWLAFLLATNVTSQLSGGFSGEASPAQLGLLGPGETLTALLCIAAGALWVGVVMSVTGEQDRTAGAPG
jgi:Domain of unknown function (DUF4328)